jgi:tRNA (mo5U34)-methyltransferase
MTEEAAARELARRVATVDWYHSLPLPYGVTTPGTFDTARELSHVPFPASLQGKRCLDVATANGFWAFEMERRGATEVIAIDLPPDGMDWPGNAKPRESTGDEVPGRRGFDIAREVLDSSVQWRNVSVYELSPDLAGQFDFVFVGSLLLHLRDPVGALRAIASVLGGELLSVDAVSLPLTIMHPRRPVARFKAHDWPLWWAPNLRAYRQMFTAARLHIVATGRPFFVKRGPGYTGPQGEDPAGSRPSFYRHPKQAMNARLGNLHAWVRATAM